MKHLRRKLKATLTSYIQIAATSLSWHKTILLVGKECWDTSTACIEIFTAAQFLLLPSTTYFVTLEPIILMVCKSNIMYCIRTS